MLFLKLQKDITESRKPFERNGKTSHDILPFKIIIFVL